MFIQVMFSAVLRIAFNLNYSLLFLLINHILLQCKRKFDILYFVSKYQQKIDTIWKKCYPWGVQKFLEVHWFKVAQFCKYRTLIFNSSVWPLHKNKYFFSRKGGSSPEVTIFSRKIVKIFTILRWMLYS